MKPTLWNALREIDEIQNRLSTFFRRTPIDAGGSGDNDVTIAQWAPVVDITEDAGEYLIKAELPDIKKEDVKVTVKDGVLTLSGERKFEKEEKDKRHHRIERAYGSFMRSFTLPDAVDAAGVKADYKNGLLSVHVPKNPKARPAGVDVPIS
jgi:HSP20 family protein